MRLHVRCTPSAPTVSTTFLAWSGWASARRQIGVPLLVNPLSSVPLDTQELRTRTRTVPASTTGAGTSSTAASPRRINTCFMDRDLFAADRGSRDVVAAVLRPVILRVV